ncbi:mRNA (guanine-N(7)-)-methyltransferase [Saitozyma sp. JCM 24511]|nr:mRNA (guanine-N(7)-)-methyltransferase [Saitozyma sp. JCM 24511]
MVYDPIRDREVPSPAETAPPLEAWKYQQHRHQEAITPSSMYSDDPRLGYNGASRPPAFAGHAPSPSAPLGRSMSSMSASTSGGGGLRGLLNDDEAESRRGSAQALSAWSEEEHRPSIHRMLSEAAPPISKSNSASSLHSASPSNQSPRPRHIDHNHAGFLTPATPASGLRASKSPVPPASPPGGAHYHEYGGYYEAGPSHSHPYSRRPSASGQRPMLPPESIPRQVDFEASRLTPSAHALPLRSPSVSVSPRSHHATLPYGQVSRPSSATSAGPGSGPGSFAFQPPPHPAASPSASSRRLSEEPRPLSGGVSHNGRRLTLPARRSSQASAYSHSTPVRSPSPIPRAPYNPHRISEPTTLLYPITPDEAAHLREAGLANNPLRRKKRARPLPSWSAPSPAGAGRATPAESDNSYFPPQEEGSAKRSMSYIPRRDSVSSAGRPSVTPGPSSAGPSPRIQSRPAPNQRQAAPGNHNKRPLEQETDGHDTLRRKVSEAHFVGNAAVANFYNARPEVGVEHREYSPIIGLKKFNNWIKSVLIGKFSYRPPGGSGARVLDIGCGKGGDLQKWRQARIQLYVGLDIAATSVQQAEERYRKIHRAPFDAFFFAHDCFSQPISNILPEPLKQANLYDNVSMQFCMHYAFESPSKARMMIENVSRYLRPGGVFIGTIPNADLLQYVTRLAEVPEDDEELRFGNSVYYIQFDERKHKGMYGHRYRFFLTDAVEDVPEYLVNWDNFEALAAEYRLRLIYKKQFNDILTEEAPSRDFGPLLGKMGVLNEHGESMMDGDQWEAAMLYMGFAFEKM